jgi:L-ascorbate metabolism protein UlaG (beta-lactamase superfamily)
MNENLMYLKPNVVMEPLVDGWYAWSHLISPATSAMNIAGRHLKIMNSYIQAPHVHASAVRNPKFLGGPFMDLDGKYVQEVEDLKAETIRNRAEMIALSAAFKELDTMLKDNAKGYSLKSLYPMVPDILKGFVELVYDLNGAPSFRIFEGLLFKSKFYNDASQSVVLWITNGDDRPFVLSTPRVKKENTITLNVPFSHEAIERIAQMKQEPGDPYEIAKVLSIPEPDMDLFVSFFQSESSRSYKRYTDDKIRMRYFGHACVLIETSNTSILVDPLISYYGYQSDVERFSDLDLPDHIDYVLITHNHQDHILFETLLPLRWKIGTLIVPKSGTGALQDPSLKLMFENIGFKNVVEIEEMQTMHFSDCGVTGIPFTGEHADLNVITKSCYHVKIGQFSVMFVADSCVMEPRLYEHVREAVGEVDVVFVGMECDGAPLSWLYGPLLSHEMPRDKDATRRLAGSNFEEAKALTEIFKPKEVYVYAMGQEPWLKFISSIKYTDESNPIVASEKLIAWCRGNGIICERLFGEKELLRDKVLVKVNN